MKPLKSAASLFAGASLFCFASFAHNLSKDEVAFYNWTGFYAGLNAGAVKHTMTITDVQATSFLATIEQEANPDFTGGFQAGYRRQVGLAQASGVYGLEFSANFSNAKFQNQYGSSFALYQLNARNELKNLCLLQFIGGIAADRTLLFLAAGLSWSNIRGNLTSVDEIPFFNALNVSKKAGNTAVGGGIEYAFSEKISARMKVDVLIPNTYSHLDDVGDKFQISNHIVQGTLGVNYKFG